MILTFDPTKPLRTRCGQEARIYATEAGGIYPIHGAVFSLRDGKWRQNAWTPSGCSQVGEESPLDLINIPEQPTFRPWKLTEVPYGGIARLKNGTRMLITPNNDWTTDATLINWVWCWPHEQFTNVWRPCGVEVKP